MIFDQERYIESTKGVITQFIKENYDNVNISTAFPDITSETLKLDKPTTFIDYVRDLNVDSKGGKRTGKGTRLKRKRLVYALYIITQGDNRSVLERDRIVQKLQGQITKGVTIKALAGKGIYEPEMSFVGSHTARENIHLSRLEFYFEIKFIN